MSPHACRHCGRAFLREDYLAAHVGRRHAERMDETELKSYHAALADEAQHLARMRRHARATMTTLPLALIVFAIIVLAVVYQASIAIVFLPLPPSLAVLGFIYYMQYSSDRGA